MFSFPNACVPLFICLTAEAMNSVIITSVSSHDNDFNSDSFLSRDSHLISWWSPLSSNRSVFFQPMYIYICALSSLPVNCILYVLLLLLSSSATTNVHCVFSFTSSAIFRPLRNTVSSIRRMRTLRFVHDCFIHFLAFTWIQASSGS